MAINMTIKCDYSDCAGEIPAIEQRPPKSGRWYGVCTTCRRSSGIAGVTERDGIHYGKAYRMGPRNPIGVVSRTYTIRPDQAAVVDASGNQSEFVQRALDEYIDKLMESDILVI